VFEWGIEDVGHRLSELLVGVVGTTPTNLAVTYKGETHQFDPASCRLDY
jgi:hypothetical protein